MNPSLPSLQFPHERILCDRGGGASALAESSGTDALTDVRSADAVVSGIPGIAVICFAGTFAAIWVIEKQNCFEARAAAAHLLQRARP